MKIYPSSTIGNAVNWVDKSGDIYHSVDLELNFNGTKISFIYNFKQVIHKKIIFINDCYVQFRFHCTYFKLPTNYLQYLQKSKIITYTGWNFR
jgi:hypothetical protein